MNPVAMENQLFDFLISHQLLEEQQQRESFCFLYELFLVHIYKNRSLNEFIQLLLEKGIERVETQVSENRTKQWFLQSSYRINHSCIKIIFFQKFVKRDGAVISASSRVFDTTACCLY
jgi:hypothetical protein